MYGERGGELSSSTQPGVFHGESANIRTGRGYIDHHYLKQVSLSRLQIILVKPHTWLCQSAKTT